MAFSLRLILLLVAVILFVIGAIAETTLDWLPWGLAAFSAAFLVSEAGLDRSLGGRRR
jgi:hypothetical protein